jgi:hypothetical protein
MIWLTIIIVLIALAYFIACYLSGENLAATWLDEWRLGRMTLKELDEAYLSNPCPSGLVVTLTTIPSRIDAIAPTLKSLLRQTAAPLQIRLCLPAWSEREHCAYVVPDWLKELRSVKIVPCSDEGPSTKFLTSLRELKADQAVLVLDDDRIYHPRLLEKLDALALEHPNEVVGAAGWSVPPDLIDHPTTLLARLKRAPYVPIRANQVSKPQKVDIVQGLHGYVVRPRFFDLPRLGDFSAAPPALRFVDDVWLSAHCRVACVVHPLSLAFTDFKPWGQRRRFDASSLGRKLNRTSNPAERGNSIALRYFEGRWNSSGRA